MITPISVDSATTADEFWSLIVFHEHHGPWRGPGVLRLQGDWTRFVVPSKTRPARCPEGFQAGVIRGWRGPHCTDADCEFDMDYSSRRVQREVHELVDLEATKLAIAQRLAVRS